MAEKEIKLMKGNEVIAHAAIRYGCDAYFGYPITPQSEVMETLMELKPWETTGMVVLQVVDLSLRNEFNLVPLLL